MAIINLGILAHVDAGKTSLTERILFETGVIPSVGSVDKGTTQTDTLELERARGITIKSAVVSFQLNELKVNLIDTPGHADFVAEVDRSPRCARRRAARGDSPQAEAPCCGDELRHRVREPRRGGRGMRS
jgi:small GTP-binding protein